VQCATPAGFEGAGSAVLDPPESRRPRRKRRRPGGAGPPGDGHGGGGGRGDGPGGHEPGSGGDGGSLGALELAFGFLLTSIGTLFVVFVAVYFVLRKSAGPSFGGAGHAALGGLWSSTLLLALSSASMLAARRAQCGGRRARARGWLAATWALGLAFLMAQASVWWRLVGSGLVPRSNAYGTLFFSLTGLHAVHVVGGLVYQAILYVRLGRGEGGLWRALRLDLCGLYWHFMGAVWLVLFALLYFSR